MNLLGNELDTEILFRKKKSIKRYLLANEESFIEKKIAILGGSTTSEIKDILELFLLDIGIKPIFYESEYNKFYEDALFSEELVKFGPDVIYLHTTYRNIKQLPSCINTEMDNQLLLDEQYNMFKTVWDTLKTKFDCVVIQNNFDYPGYRDIGNLSRSYHGGIVNFIDKLNRLIVNYTEKNKNFLINDINYLSANIGLARWHDLSLWYLYKYAVSFEAIPYIAKSLANIIQTVYGKSKKCLVLDLDNTLWGGVIGDDGINGIEIGKETPKAENFTEFQKYVLNLKKRGVILAVCSKNDIENAKLGLEHPDSILTINDFAVIKANWQPKHLNIVEIAHELNIGLDSIVFIDDNPAEQKIVKENLPEVVVPEIKAADISSYIRMIDEAGYFETISVSQDDLLRNKAYKENAKRKRIEKDFINYDDFLKSLEMKAEIKPFIPIYFERITQLTNKTNQFNLTTKRYTQAEIEEVANNQNYITLYGRLKDKFGDNGIVSVIIAEIRAYELHIDLWLMSCRVLKRGMENAMMEQLLDRAKKAKIKKIFGYYCKTNKNKMVSDLYKMFNFRLVEANNENSIWCYETLKEEISVNKFIQIHNE